MLNDHSARVVPVSKLVCYDSVSVLQGHDDLLAVVAAWVDFRFQINVYTSINEFSLHLIIDILCSFLDPDSLLFVKLVEILSKDGKDIFCCLENIDTKVKHTSSSVLVVASPGSWIVRILWVVELGRHTHNLIFVESHLGQQGLVGNVKRVMHSDVEAILIRSNLSHKCLGLSSGVVGWLLHQHGGIWEMLKESDGVHVPGLVWHRWIVENDFIILGEGLLDFINRLEGSSWELRVLSDEVHWITGES